MKRLIPILILLSLAFSAVPVMASGIPMIDVSNYVYAVDLVQEVRACAANICLYEDGTGELCQLSTDEYFRRLDVNVQEANHWLDSCPDELLTNMEWIGMLWDLNDQYGEW